MLCIGTPRLMPFPPAMSSAMRDESCAATAASAMSGIGDLGNVNVCVDGSRLHPRWRQRCLNSEARRKAHYPHALTHLGRELHQGGRLAVFEEEELRGVGERQGRVRRLDRESDLLADGSHEAVEEHGVLFAGDTFTRAVDLVVRALHHPALEVHGPTHKHVTEVRDVESLERHVELRVLALAEHGEELEADDNRAVRGGGERAGEVDVEGLQRRVVLRVRGEVAAPQRVERRDLDNRAWDQQCPRLLNLTGGKQVLGVGVWWGKVKARLRELDLGVS